MKRLSLPTAARRVLTLLPALVLSAHAAASAPLPRQVMVETFRIALDDWNRIPPAVRDNHRQLYDKCRAAGGRGKVECIDRIGGYVGTGKRAFEAITSVTYGTSFTTNGKMLMPDTLECRNTGSTLEFELEADAANPLLRLVYERIPQPALWRPMLDKGSADNIKRSELPVFDTMRINASLAGAVVAGPALLGVLPIPASGEKSGQLALIFTVPSGFEPPAAPAVFNILMELLVLRGPAGGGPGDPAARITSLQARPGALETILAVATAADGRKATAESVTGWIYPTDASRDADVIEPQAMESLNQGSTLHLECRSAAAGVCEILFMLEHDLLKPLLPVATGKGAKPVSPETVTRYRITVTDSIKLVPDVWTALKEVPLDPILGSKAGTAKNQACHVFARATVMK